MSNIKLVNNYWETSGVYDIAEGKTQRQVNSSKMNKPTVAGTSGQILRSDGQGGAVWDNAATQEEIGEAVTDWLDENVPTGQTVVVDASLSISGAAADAKITGEHSKAIYAKIASEDETYAFLFGSGGLNTSTGGTSTDNTKIRTTGVNLITVGKNDIVVIDKPYEVRLAFYNRSISTTNFLGMYPSSYTSGVIKIPDEYVGKCIALVIRNSNTPSSDISSEVSTVRQYIHYWQVFSDNKKYKKRKKHCLNIGLISILGLTGKE